MMHSDMQCYTNKENQYIDKIKKKKKKKQRKIRMIQNVISNGMWNAACRKKMCNNFNNDNEVCFGLQWNKRKTGIYKNFPMI